MGITGSMFALNGVIIQPILKRTDKSVRPTTTESHDRGLRQKTLSPHTGRTFMNRVHVIGRKNHGKTQLVMELVEEFTARGLRVGTIKHTHHHHELDTPGKDSHRHRTAGAAMVGVLSRNTSAVFIPCQNSRAGDDRYAVVSAIFAGCDLVIVEGDSQTLAPKIEVWRAAVGTPPIAAQDNTVLAVVTDDPLDIDTVLCRRANVPELASWILDNVTDSADHWHEMCPRKNNRDGGVGHAE